MKRTVKQNVYQLMRLIKYNNGYSSKIMDIFRVAYTNNKNVINLRDEYLSMVVNRCNNSDTPLFLLYKNDVPIVFISIDFNSKTILSLLPIERIDSFSSKKHLFLALFLLLKQSRTISLNDTLHFRLNRKINNKRLKLTDYLGGNDYRYSVDVSLINKIGTKLFNKLSNKP